MKCKLRFNVKNLQILLIGYYYSKFYEKDAGITIYSVNIHTIKQSLMDKNYILFLLM